MLQRRTLGTPAESRVLAITEICRRLNITTMSTHNWRRGTKTRRPLPVLYGHQGSAVRVGVDEAELMAWLHQYRPDLIAVWNATQT